MEEIEARLIPILQINNQHLNMSINLSLCALFLFAAPNGFSGLLIRSAVLSRLGQFQSSLADADNALRSRPMSAKVSVLNVSNELGMLLLL